MSERQQDKSDVTGQGNDIRRTGMIARLYTMLDHKMGEIESRIARATQDEGIDGAYSPADSEREARTLASLARLLEKLNELEGAERSPGRDGDSIEMNPKEIDAERLRGEITDRLERIRGCGLL